MHGLDKLTACHSCDWAIEMHAVVNGLLVVLGWNGTSEMKQPQDAWIVLAFDRPTSYAVADYSRLWQHSSGERDTPVLTVNDHATGTTHILDLTLNLESYPDGWISCRVEAQCDAIDIICRELPTVTFRDSEPDVLKWWSQGHAFDQRNA